MQVRYNNKDDIHKSEAKNLLVKNIESKKSSFEITFDVTSKGCMYTLLIYLAAMLLKASSGILNVFLYILNMSMLR